MSLTRTKENYSISVTPSEFTHKISTPTDAIDTKMTNANAIRQLELAEAQKCKAEKSSKEKQPDNVKKRQMKLRQIKQVKQAIIKGTRNKMLMIITNLMQTKTRT